jgi:hypothetical protein
LGAESALSAMLGRTAAYTGREATWDELLRSTETWDAGIDLEKLAVSEAENPAAWRLPYELLFPSRFRLRRGCRTGRLRLG